MAPLGPSLLCRMGMGTRGRGGTVSSARPPTQGACVVHRFFFWGFVPRDNGGGRRPLVERLFLWVQLLATVGNSGQKPLCNCFLLWGRFLRVKYQTVNQHAQK